MILDDNAVLPALQTLSSGQQLNPRSARWIEPLKNISADIRSTVAFEIGFAVPEVQAVFSCLDEKSHVLHVWAVVPERERDIYRKVYSAEKQLIEKFGHLGFDFNVIASCGRDPSTLLNNPGVELSYLRR